MKIHRTPPDGSPSAPPVTGLAAAGAPTETLYVSFWLVADRDLLDVRVSGAAFDGGTGPTPDLWVVKRWTQSGLGLNRGAGVDVEELLLKDDRGDVPRGRWGFRFDMIRSCLRRRRFFRAPDFRLRGPVETDLPAGQPKRFMAVIRIPADARPGRSAGALRVESKGKTLRIPFDIDVWPIRLTAPRQDLLLWYKATTKEWMPQHFVSPAMMSLQLADIAAAGFHGVSVFDAEPDRARDILRRARAAGLDGPFIVMPPYDERTHRVFSDLGVGACYCVSDEPHEPEEFRRHEEFTRIAKRWNGITLTSMLGRDATADIESLYLPGNTRYFALRSQLPEMRRGKTYYYWTSHMEKPNLNRVLAGVYLWKSKADGIVPYCYQHLPRPPGSPFDDFCDWEPVFHPGFRNHMTTYPARNGTVWTLQWVGLADGITDLKYLSTLEDLVARARNAGSTAGVRAAEEAEADVKRFMDRIDLADININSDTEPEPYASIPPTAYDDFRRAVAGHILTLLEALGADKTAETIR